MSLKNDRMDNSDFLKTGKKWWRPESRSLNMDRSRGPYESKAIVLLSCQKSKGLSCPAKPSFVMF